MECYMSARHCAKSLGMQVAKVGEDPSFVEVSLMGERQ